MRLILLLLAGLCLVAGSGPAAAVTLPCANVIGADGKPDCVPVLQGKIVVPDAAAARGLATGGLGGAALELAAQANGAPALDLVPGSGPCAADDGVSCINSADGNSWVASFPTVNALYWGPKGDGVSDDFPMLVAALNFASAHGRCLYIPAAPGGKGYFISAPLQPSTIVNGSTNCITGDAPSFANYSPSYNPTFNQSDKTYSGTFLLTHDTDCLVAPHAPPTRWQNLGCSGNGSTSTSASETNGFLVDRLFGFTAENLVATGYVDCLSIAGATVFPVIHGLRCDEHYNIPNRVNNYPQYCVNLYKSSNPAAAGTVQAGWISGLQCRGGSQVTLFTPTPNGSTTWFDTLLDDGTGSAQRKVIWTADELVWTLDGFRQVLGADYTLWDCGASPCAGTGGSQLFGQTVTATLTQGSPNATITSGSAAGWPAPGSPSNLLAWSLNGIDEPTYVQSITDPTHLVLSRNANVSVTVRLTVVQTAIASAGGSRACQAAGTCGTNLETRFLVAPPNGSTLAGTFNQLWYPIAINVRNVGDIYFGAADLAGARLLFKHTTGYGGVTLQASYVEIMGACMSVDYEPSGGRHLIGDVVNMGRETLINAAFVDPAIYQPANTSAENCPHYIDPLSYGNKLVWNSSDWTKITLKNTGSSVTFGSQTAPMNQAEGAVHEYRLQNIRCATAGQLTMQVSEDGLTNLAGTNYLFHSSNSAAAAATYVGANSAGTSNFPLSAQQQISPTTGYNGRVWLSEAGRTDNHTVQVLAGGAQNSGTVAVMNGSGIITGTPAALVSVKFACSNGGTLNGTIYHRVVY